MADNTTLSVGTGGDVIASDDITGVKFQRVKLTLGADGVNNGDVASGNPMPVSAATLPLPTGAATETTLAAANTVLQNVSDTVNSAITAAHPVIDTRAILFAVNPGGTYGNIERTTGGNLKVAVEEFDAALPAGTNNIGDVDVLTINGVAPAFGTGLRGATVQRVTIATDDVVPITDNAGSLTVDAPVATPVFVRLSDGAAAIATLPVSLASLPTLAAGVNNIGDVDVLTLPPLATGTNVIGALTANQSVNNSQIAGVATAVGNGVTGTGSQRVTIASDNTAFAVNATPPTLTKGTQGAIGYSTQDLKDAGRNAVHYYSVIPVLTSATDTLLSLTGTKAGATVVATTTPAVVTAAKTLRITRIAASYIATATSGYVVVRLRFNTAGLVAITSPVATTMAVGAGTPATANSVGSEEAALSDGWEFAAGTGIGISAQGFAAATATAVGYVFVSVTGFEY